MVIVVTGAAGFIGSHIVRNLIDDTQNGDAHAVIAVDDFSGVNSQWMNICDHVSIMHQQVRYHRFDCSNLQLMQDLCRMYKPDIIVHCAANAREGASQFQPHSIAMRNLVAGSSVLSAGIQHGVKKFVMFSSMSVYGAQKPPFDESMPPVPEDVYAVNKAALEHTTKILCDVHGCSYAIIRPHNVFGEHQALFDKHRNVAGIFMNRIMREEPLFIYGDGEQTRAFSYIDDSLPCFRKVIDGVGVDQDLTNITINIGGIEPITINEIANKVILAMGVDKSYPIDYYRDRPREVKHAYTTYELSQQLVGYNEEYGWESGIQRMADWAKKDRGPQAWLNTDKLEIINDLVPEPWLEDDRGGI